MAHLNPGLMAFLLESLAGGESESEPDDGESESEPEEDSSDDSSNALGLW